MPTLHRLRRGLSTLGSRGVLEPTPHGHRGLLCPALLSPHGTHSTHRALAQLGMKQTDVPRMEFIVKRDEKTVTFTGPGGNERCGEPPGQGDETDLAGRGLP